MNQQTKPKHRPFPEMVAALFKRLDTESATLMHAVVGIAGEATEIAMARNRANVIEEGSDMEFYIEAAFQSVERITGQSIGRPTRPGPELNVPDTDAMPAYADVPIALLKMGGVLIDATKKTWIYGRDLKVQETLDALFSLCLLLDCMYQHVGVEHKDVIERNQDKLDGPNGRFPDGYSDAAALARADKSEGEAAGTRKFFHDTPVVGEAAKTEGADRV